MIEHREFQTGAKRASLDGKPRMDLIPWHVMDRVGYRYQPPAGIEDRNWERGMPAMQLVGSLVRHLIAWVCRMDDEDHAAAIVWNALAILDHDERWKNGDLDRSVDDRPGGGA